MVLCGGVGAARFLKGLVAVVDPASVVAIVNVGDDAGFNGLHVSPDLDTVLYTLAELVDETQGWGRSGDTFRVRAELARLGADTWFALGDLDLAVHVRRTELLRGGGTLAEATESLRQAFDVGTRILPATNDPQPTSVRTPDGWLAFQEYFVRRHARDRVLEVRLPRAGAAPGVLEAIRDAERVVLAPSNPIVSIGPILAVDGVREALRATKAALIAVTPIIRGAAVKGPAAEMLAGLGHEVSPVGVARLYADFLDALVVDEQDAELAPRIASLGVRPILAQTLMHDAAARASLARAALELAGAR